MVNLPSPVIPALAEHFCVADGQTAALITPKGLCDFWCAPNFDSPLRLAGILDGDCGGHVGVVPQAGGWLASRWLADSSLVVVEWSGSVRVTLGLLGGGRGRSSLAFLIEGPPGTELALQLAGAGPDARWAVFRQHAELPASPWPDGPGGPLHLACSEPLESTPGGARMRLGRDAALVWVELCDADSSPSESARRIVTDPTVALASARQEMELELTDGKTWLASLADRSAVAVALHQGPPWAQRALIRSLLTLRSLQDRASGLVVASPLLSIPQWPASERAWDYRYAWLRDCADAGLALVRAGAWPEAERLALGLARRLASGDNPPVARLDGGPLPPEHVLGHLSGYGGGMVRIGNAAAGQVQVDTLGEVMRFIEALALSDRCPAPLLGLVPELADRAHSAWRQADHGIWEVRGQPRHYLHSKLMAWAALEAALRLHSQGRLDHGDAAAWGLQRDEIADAIRSYGTDADGALKMAFDDPSADSSTLAAYLIGYLGPGSRAAPATLDRVTAELGDEFLVARYHPERDGFASPCAPFIFPSLWAVIAEARLGRRRDAELRLRSIVELAGPPGQLSEVALPGPGSLLGNYPQVQSHAALVEAVLELFGDS